MRSWKVIIEYEKEPLEIIVQAKYYSDAYIEVEKKYSGCIIKNVSEIKE
jgi:hypothetical protein